MEAAGGLRVAHLSKRFPGVQALDDVSLAVDAGTICALVGENGAGKSTLLKIICGVYRPDSGELYLDDTARVFRSPAEAFAAGVAVIHQELNLVPEMSVAHNLLLGHPPNRWGLLDKRALRARAMEEIGALGEDIDPDAKVGRLPMAQRQMIEIGKALLRGARVIAFDEPTSSLTDREVQRLFATIRELKAQGRTILYVSHRLQEVFQLCDSAAVLRDGRLVEVFPDLGRVTSDELVTRMVGREIRDIYHYSARTLGEPALEVDGLHGPGLAEPASLQVARGEIVGLFGLVGAGRTELLKLIYGAVRPHGGTVRVVGEPLQVAGPREALDRGVAFCSEDRRREGIVAIRSVRENLNLSARRRLAPWGILRARPERENAERQVRALDVRAASLAQQAGQLSGGNQQKVLLGRALSGDVRVLLLDEPTRGVDVGAKSEIYRLVSELASRGMAVLFASSDLPEVLGAADRIVVMRFGRIVASLNRSEADEEKVLRLALPVSVEELAARA